MSSAKENATKASKSNPNDRETVYEKVASHQGQILMSIHKFCGPFKAAGFPCPFQEFEGHDKEPDDDDNDDDSSAFDVPSLPVPGRRNRPKGRFTNALAEADAVRTAYMEALAKTAVGDILGSPEGIPVMKLVQSQVKEGVLSLPKTFFESSGTRTALSTDSGRNSRQPEMLLKAFPLLLEQAVTQGDLAVTNNSIRAGEQQAEKLGGLRADREGLIFPALGVAAATAALLLDRASRPGRGSGSRGVSGGGGKFFDSVMRLGIPRGGLTRRLLGRNFNPNFNTVPDG